MAFVASFWARAAACVLALLLIAAASGSVAAQGVTRFGPAPGDENAPVLLKADEITYDEALSVVTARGHVEISQGERVLLADVVSYNQKTEVMTASGNVSLLEPTGEVYFSDYAEFTNEMRDGVIS